MCSIFQLLASSKIFTRDGQARMGGNSETGGGDQTREIREFKPRLHVRPPRIKGKTTGAFDPMMTQRL